ncbi:MAG: mobile mystery protein B [Rhabdochlamydiaceae bacterium]|nr:mobile mystery protein B [Candidatus Amphrikana amoebophyrae]
MTSFYHHPEGATPLNDYSGLIPKWVHSMEDLNLAEASNIQNAQKKHLRSKTPQINKWFTPTFLKKIHSDMFNKVWDWAGKYRSCITSIGVKPNKIPFLTAEFCMQVQNWHNHPTQLTPLERSAIIHHRLVQIHPFENGNGRFSRLVADKYLLSWECHIPIWPSALNNNNQVRKKYINCLVQDDKLDKNNNTSNAPN